MKRHRIYKMNRGHIGRKRVLYDVSPSLLPAQCRGFSRNLNFTFVSDHLIKWLKNQLLQLKKVIVSCLLFFHFLYVEFKISRHQKFSAVKATFATYLRALPAKVHVKLNISFFSYLGYNLYHLYQTFYLEIELSAA